MIQLDDDSLGVVRTILQATPLSRSYSFVIFGSCARGDAKKFSDIDIGIVGKSPVSLRDIALLDEQFKESNLPYNVDVVDLSSTSPEFRRLAYKEAQEKTMKAWLAA